MQNKMANVVPEKLTKKEKVGYWFKMVYLTVFGLIMAFTFGYIMYMLFAGLYTFGIAEFMGLVLFGSGAAFCFWCVSWLWKEYKYWINKEKEDAAKQAEQKE